MKKGKLNVGDVMVNAEGKTVTLEEWKPNAGFNVKGKFLVRDIRGITSQLNANELTERGYKLA